MPALPTPRERAACPPPTHPPHPCAGAVLLFLLLGLLPALDSLAFALFSLLAMAIVLRLYVLQQHTHQYAQHLFFSADARRRLLALASSHGIDTLNLQLTLVDREFHESDYEALLVLDEGAGERCRPVPGRHQGSGRYQGCRAGV